MKALLEELTEGVTTHSAEETQQVAKDLAALLPHKSTLALHGDLGVGKSTFVRGLARGWNIKEAITSPTYNLFIIYEGDRSLIHLDAYRLNDSADEALIMLEELITPPYCLAIEWAENIPDFLPKDTWHLYFSIKSECVHEIKLLPLA